MQYFSSTPKKFPEYLSLEEFSALMKATESNHHKLAFMLAFGSGLRVSEVINLKPENIDFKSKKIFIRDAKGGKDRVVPLPKGFPESYLKHIPLLCGIRALQIGFKSAIKRAKIEKPGIHFHSLRHSFTIHCFELGMPPNQVQVLLGHDNLATTSIYARVHPKDALDSYERLW